MLGIIVKSWVQIASGHDRSGVIQTFFSLSPCVPHCLLSHCENSMVTVTTVQSGLCTKLCDIGAGLIYKEQCLGVNWNQGGSVFFGDCRMTFWWVSRRHTMLIMTMIRVFVFCCSMNDENIFWCRQNMVSCRLWLLSWLIMSENDTVSTPSN